MSVSMQWVQPFVSAALAASDVGTWDFDVVADCCRGDETFARLYGLSAYEAAKGVSMKRIAECLHPEDMEIGRAKRLRMLDEGGMFVLEYRTVPSPGLVRWLLGRGRYVKDAAGRVIHGRGIVIDVTDSKREGYVEGQAFFTVPVTSIFEETALERAARFTLLARKAIDEIKNPAIGILRKLLDAVLMEIGRQLVKGDRSST